MSQILLIFHIFFAIALIGLVLLQQGKGAGMGVAFGSGASQTVFGSKGSVGFMMKLTLLVGALFFATSIALTYLAAHQDSSTQKHSLLRDVEKISQSKQSKESSAPAQSGVNKLPAKPSSTRK
ncbi:MAG: preprotein translocase subunit SecG [Pseudomonadota bacterium]|nr:preprotein translocase subunit SecG [Gammaproteobacteria bacterium]MBU1558953.1 preprotein translocase subunit SecG [Gammaproteobacteria bacterium]MBU1628838.1 preprotein translocase subunit SecG [Gammaproteobacteria bacterium]MBU1927175.1 preprotein translocase subunit SecG [Gammaproteobacteria bacterium]MBU2545531.1 preprotein translocase subunit SecG [Gammaproteobacteria bacterium]